MVRQDLMEVVGQGWVWAHAADKKQKAPAPSGVCCPDAPAYSLSLSVCVICDFLQDDGLVWQGSGADRFAISGQEPGRHGWRGRHSGNARRHVRLAWMDNAVRPIEV
jgi:hypothetical protein